MALWHENTINHCGFEPFPKFRDAEMTIKIIFERSSQKGGRQGVRKEGQQGTHLEIFIVGLKHRKNSILGKSDFYCLAIFPRKYSDNNLDNYPPSPPSRGSD